jgi:hypothetical protein
VDERASRWPARSNRRDLKPAFPLPTHIADDAEAPDDEQAECGRFGDGRAAEGDLEHGPKCAIGSLPGIETPGGERRRFVPEQNPTDVAGWVNEPTLCIGDHTRCGIPVQKAVPDPGALEPARLSTAANAAAIWEPCPSTTSPRRTGWSS